MSPVQYRYRSDYEKAIKFSDQLHNLMESGEFWRLSFLQRRKLVRRLNRLYKRLTGVFHLPRIRTVLLAAGVIALTGCPEATTGGGNSDPVVEISEGDQIVANGETATFTVVATDADGDTLTYAWFVDDVDQNEASETFSVAFTPVTETVYEIRVDVSDGTTTVSDAVDLTVAAQGLAVTISGASGVDNGVVEPGVSATFEASVSNPGDGTLSYQWSLDGSELTGETDSSVTIEFDDSYPNVYEVSVAVSEGSRSGSRSVDVTARIEPVFLSGSYAGNGLLTPVNYVVDTGVPLTAFLLGDLDGDGDTDALMVSYDYNSYFSELYVKNMANNVAIDWLRNDGTDPEPSFSNQGAPAGFTDLQYDVGDYEGYVIYKPLDLADIDGDGDADILMGTIQRSVEETYIGGGYSGYNITFDFGFSIWENDSSGSAPSFTAGADFNQYGLPSTYAVLEDQFDHYGRDMPGLPASTRDWIASGRLVDMDDDGDLDFVYSYFHSEGAGRVVALAENSGGLGENSAFDNPDDIIDTDLVPPEHDNGSTYVMPNIHAADLDLDGDVDILAGNSYTESGYFFQFFENTGTPDDPLFETVSPADPFGLSYYASDYGVTFNGFDIQTIDIDDDGDLDIFSGWDYYSEYVLTPALFENHGVGYSGAG